MSDQLEGRVTAAKAGSAVLVGGGAASLDWGTIASILATIYTAALLCEWVWKKLLRPFAESRGWVKRRRRRAGDAADSDRVGL
jgi:hypothetical protein